MNLIFNEKNNEIDIWVMSKEKNNKITVRMLDVIIRYCKENDLFATVFISGEKELNKTTLSLLVNQMKDDASA